MTRVFVIARTEFLAVVRGKAFIIGILLVPVIIGLSILLQTVADARSDVAMRRVAVIDGTGVLYDTLAAAADEHNAQSTHGGAAGPTFRLERVDPAGRPADQLALALSERVRARDLFAFVEIPATILDTSRTDGDQVRYFTETPSYQPLPQWIRVTLEREAAIGRFERAGVDPSLVDRLSRATSITTLGLLSRAPDGAIVEASRIDPVQAFVVPFVSLTLLFVAVMSAAPLLLTSTVEEKMSRISEVLLASVSPGQLMAGKLAGVSAVSIVLALIYVLGGIYLALASGQPGLINVPLLLWFTVFLIMAVLMFGAIFIAVGAACSDLKDSQNLMQPVVVFLTLPLVAAPVVIRTPDSMLATLLSMFPTFTPFLMLMRLALTPPPPLWQVLVSLILTALTTAAIVWAAGRIFRVGLLMHGKPPNLPELLRWIRQ